jgi:SAM-dependent MidA family methyltransferase
MLAAIDDQRGAGNRACGGKVTDCRGDVFRGTGFAKRRDAMRGGKAVRGLFAGLQCNAWRNRNHPKLWGQCLRQHGRRRVQRSFRQCIRKKIGIQIKQFLVQQINDDRLRAVRSRRVQRLRQHQWRRQINLHMGRQRVVAECGGAVLFEQGGIIDQTGDGAQRHCALHESGHLIRIAQIALQRPRASSQCLDLANCPVGILCGLMIMQCNIPALPRKCERDHATDAFRGAGDQCYFHCVHGFLWLRIHGFQYNTAMQLQLPAPSADALDASLSLQRLIADEIRRQQGWISFARYMELVLYAPHLGYYSGGATKLGKEGDFTTAPELSPLFGATLAKLAAELFAQTAPVILEFGAGSGKLAFDILRECQMAGVALRQYLIVEVSPQLRARQQQTLADFPIVQWLDRLPDHFSGVVIGNEVLDAMPVSLVIRADDGWQERGVALADMAEVSGAPVTFAFEDRPCAQTLVAQIPDAAHLPIGYLTEVHPLATAFMGSLAAMLGGSGVDGGVDGGVEGGVEGAAASDRVPAPAPANGAAAILIDYGFPGHEYYLGQRSQGTLMCHYRHHAHPDPFYLPGLQDVTAHVDFTAMARAAVDGGLALLGYTSQAAFLLGAGIGELLLRTPPEQATQYLPQANAVQKLISPAEMGELFKVLAVGRDVDWPDRLLQHDRSYRL